MGLRTRLRHQVPLGSRSTQAAFGFRASVPSHPASCTRVRWLHWPGSLSLFRLEPQGEGRGLAHHLAALGGGADAHPMPRTAGMQWPVVAPEAPALVAGLTLPLVRVCVPTCAHVCVRVRVRMCPKTCLCKHEKSTAISLADCAD